MKIRIGTDSTADIPKEICEKLGINVLPLSIVHEGKEYVEGVDVVPETFYGLLETCDTIPSLLRSRTPFIRNFTKKLSRKAIRI